MAASNGKSITKNLGGRPTKFVDSTVKKLESIFKIGGTVGEATSYAGVSRQIYYDEIKRNPSFLTKMEAAQHYADVAAKNVVIDAIITDKDINTAKWWLEKRQFKDAGVQITGDKILVIPGELLEKHGITSDTETSSEE